MMKTAVIYARFSCSKQREASIKDQLRVCREWCAREGYSVVAEYCDEAKSGRTDNRPEFQHMIANAGESDIVLVYMMDRFSRDIYDAPIYKKLLRDHGTKVVSATESLPDGPEAMIMENLYEAMAAMESSKIGKRTKRGMEGNAMNCQYNGDRVFGYSVDPHTKKYVVDRQQAEIVRDCFSMRAEGESVNAIARALAERGVRTYRGKPCSHSMVYNMLRNRRYIGVYKWGDIEVEDGMPAIITMEEWNMAQNAPQKKRRKHEDWSDYAFAGKAVCGGCAYNMVGKSGRGRNGKKYSYYACGEGCGNVKPVPKQWLESHVAEALRELVSDRDVALQIGRRLEEYQKSSKVALERKRAEESLREADKGIANIIKAIEQGITAPDLQKRLDELYEQQEQAKLIIAKMDALKFDAETFADFMQFASTLTDEKLIDMLVWQIYVQNDEIVVTLNYDVEPDVPQRITVDGYSQFSDEKESANQSVQDWFAQFESGSPFAYFYETRSGLAIAMHNGRIAFVLQRAA